MRVKVKNILWPMRHLYAAHVVCEFDEYEGESMPPPKGAAKGTICLSTGIKKFPMRMIDPDSIVSIDGVEVEKISG